MNKKELNLKRVKLNVVNVVCKITVLATLIIFFNSYTAFAQCDPDNPGTPNGCDPNDIDDAPIDGGASILIAAGVAYGLKKAYDKRKQNKETDVA